MTRQQRVWLGADPFKKFSLPDSSAAEILKIGFSCEHVVFAGDAVSSVRQWFKVSSEMGLRLISAACNSSQLLCKEALVVIDPEPASNGIVHMNC